MDISANLRCQTSKHADVVLHSNHSMIVSLLDTSLLPKVNTLSDLKLCMVACLHRLKFKIWIATERLKEGRHSLC